MLRRSFCRFASLFLMGACFVPPVSFGQVPKFTISTLAVNGVAGFAGDEGPATQKVVSLLSWRSGLGRLRHDDWGHGAPFGWAPFQPHGYSLQFPHYLRVLRSCLPGARIEKCPGACRSMLRVPVSEQFEYSG